MPASQSATQAISAVNSKPTSSALERVSRVHHVWQKNNWNSCFSVRWLAAFAVLSGLYRCCFCCYICWIAVAAVVLKNSDDGSRQWLLAWSILLLLPPLLLLSLSLLLVSLSGNNTATHQHPLAIDGQHSSRVELNMTSRLSNISRPRGKSSGSDHSNSWRQLSAAAATNLPSQPYDSRSDAEDDASKNNINIYIDLPSLVAWRLPIHQEKGVKMHINTSES